jgi:hypothetical protein
MTTGDLGRLFAGQEAILIGGVDFPNLDVVLMAATGIIVAERMVQSVQGIIFHWDR